MLLPSYPDREKMEEEDRVVFMSSHRIFFKVHNKIILGFRLGKGTKKRVFRQLMPDTKPLWD